MGASDFSANSAQNGGALGTLESPIIVNDSDFAGNFASEGGAVYTLQGYLDLSDSIFIENSAGQGGGAVSSGFTKQTSNITNIILYQ